MCLAIPMEILEINENIARCRAGESSTYVNASTDLVEEHLAIGDYVIVHAGFALRKMEKEDAEETLSLLRKMSEADPTSSLP